MVDDFTFHSAVDDELVVQFWYSKVPGDAGALRVLSPWQIDEEKDNVLGWDHHRDEIRQFSMYKATGLEPADEQYVFPHDP